MVKTFCLAYFLLNTWTKGFFSTHLIHLTETTGSIRSSSPEAFLGKAVLKICNKFTGEHPCWSVISTKLRCNFIEIKLQHGCSMKWNFIPVNLLHIFRTHFYKNTSRGLLLCSWTGDDVYWDSFQLCIQNPVIHLRGNKTANG